MVLLRNIPNTCPCLVLFVSQFRPHCKHNEIKERMQVDINQFSIDRICLFFKAPSNFLKKKMETELASLVVTLYRKLSLSLHLPFSFSMIFVSEPTITASVSARFHRSRLRCTAGSPSFAFPRLQICQLRQTLLYNQQGE